MPGPGIVADPNEIKSYGSAVGDQESSLARINSALARTALGANAFGMMPEAGELHTAYTQHADQVRQITSQLPGQIAEVASGLHTTASIYADTEGDLAQGITQILELPGAGGSGGKAVGQGVSVFASVVSNTMSAYDWVNAPEESLPALASVQMTQGGIGGMIDAAINWVINHVPELPKLLNDVTGDVDALQAAAATWHDQGLALNDVIKGLKTPAACFPDAWAGDASASFGQFMGDVTTSLSTIVGAMGQTQQILQDAAKESAFAHDTIVMIIQQVVEWVVGNILVDALTLGLGTAVDAAGTAAFLSAKVEEAEQAASKLATVYKTLKEVVESLGKLKEGVQEAKGLARLQKFMSLGKDFDESALEAAKLRNLRVFSDGKLAKAADMIWDAGKHGKNAEEVEEVLKMGKTALATKIGVKAAMSGAVGATGLPATAGLKGLGEAYVDGTLDDLKDNGQGFAETTHLQSPPVNRITQLLNGMPPADQEK